MPFKTGKTDANESSQELALLPVLSFFPVLFALLSPVLLSADSTVYPRSPRVVPKLRTTC